MSRRRPHPVDSHATAKEQPKLMTTRIRRLAAVLTLGLCVFALGAASALASGPKIALHVDAPDSLTVGKPVKTILTVENIGDAPLSGNITVTYNFPVGIAPTEPFGDFGLVTSCEATGRVVTCQLATSGTGPAVNGLPGGQLVLRTFAQLEAGAAGTLVNSIEVSGGGTGQTLVSEQTLTVGPVPFAFKTFQPEMAGSTDQAGSDPAAVATTVAFPTFSASIGGFFPITASVGQFRDVIAHVPAGLIGNPESTPDRCTSSQLLAPSPDAPHLEIPNCPPDSQIGVVRLNNGQMVPAYAMVPRLGVPAEFGFTYESVPTLLAARLRPGDYGVDIVSRNAPTTVPLHAAEVTFWGVPSDSSHDPVRGLCLDGQEGNNGLGPGPYGSCPSSAPPAAFLRLPTSCTGPLQWSAEADSYQHPGTFVSKQATTPGMEGCANEPFDPSLTLSPTTNATSSPSGLDVSLTLPQASPLEPEALATSDLKKAVVTLPEGMTINPSSAAGLAACTDSQLRLGEEGAAECPEASRIGSASLRTPLLEEEVKGSVYLRTQNSSDPASGEMFRIAVELRNDARGVDVKLPGQVAADPATGRLTTTFDNNPQLPFEELQLHLKSGPRAPLTTPSSCGTHAAAVSLGPWSGNPPATPPASFSLDHGCGAPGFSPSFEAGTRQPLAGLHSPFVLHLTRGDGERELASLQVALPPGLLATLKGVPYCPEAALAAAAAKSGAAEQASPSCPAASEVGTVTVGAGEGPSPYFVSGKAYLTGPYKSAPVGLAVVVPAVAGPFDLGTVVVRSALQVDQTDAHVTVATDPLPQIRDGVPLHLRSVAVSIDRPGFTLNPTSCNPMAITATVGGSEGATASPASRFQVGECGALSFKPKLHLALKGQTRRAGFPALHATLTMPKAPGANIAAARVTLPSSLQIENSHIQTPCTRPQFAEAACPKSSILGYAKATSPLLEAPLAGPVYFRSNGGEHLLPDLVADLRGQIHVVLVGHIDSVSHHGVTRIRNSFESVPDAPVSKFTLNLFGGKRGYLVNNRNLCLSTQRASIAFDAQNGKTADSVAKVTDACGAGGKGKGHRGRGHRGHGAHHR